MIRAVLLVAMCLHGVLTVQSWSAHGYLGFFPPFEHCCGCGFWQQRISNGSRDGRP